MPAKAPPGLTLLEGREALREWSAEIPDGTSLGFVPTMGSLHEGHLSLARQAASTCSKAVVSIFVNPLQFGDPEDFSRYPRDPLADCALLADAAVDAVYLPAAADMEASIRRRPAEGPAAERWEAEFRPGHCEGMLTVVGEFFRQVGATHAFFGEKDAQQLFLVREMAAASFPGLEVVSCPTVREPDGLALSSRNARLTADDRKLALALPESLAVLAGGWEGGERGIAVLEEILAASLKREGVQVDYASLVDDPTFHPAGPSLSGPWRACVAARVGGVRLIDNLLLGGP